jgi:formylglycine-generating enzyme required for sulfatase activity
MLTLHRLPAVVAMQFEISDRAAIAFAADFYRVLAESGAVDEAVCEARQAVFCLPNEIEWGTPVLFLHAPDGMLFELPVEKKPQPDVQPPAGGQTVEIQGDVSGTVVVAGDTNTVTVTPPGPGKAKPGSGGALSKIEKTLPKPAGPGTPRIGEIKPELLSVGGMEFCRVRSGAFLMGSREGQNGSREEEYPQHLVNLAYDYWIGRYPVTNAQFAEFARQENLRGRLDQGKPADHPVVDVNWHQALRFCAWFSERNAASLPKGYHVSLPSEAEWEKAARGTDGRLYPWGDAAPERERCNIERWYQGTTAVGRFCPLGDSPYGCADMAGNVWEWTRSLWGSNFAKSEWRYPYLAEDGRENLKAGENILRVLRGGSWLSDRNGARCASRYGYGPVSFDFDVGFRLVCSPIQL